MRQHLSHLVEGDDDATFEGRVLAASEHAFPDRAALVALVRDQ